MKPLSFGWARDLVIAWCESDTSTLGVKSFAILDQALLALLVDMSLHSFIGMFVCMGFYGAYNYSGLVRQVSGFIYVSVSA